MSRAGTLYVLCGKMAAGKSTLARELAQRNAAILLVQDDWLDHRHLADGAAWTTVAEFDAVTKYFQPPTVDEGFNVIRHARA